MYTMYKDPIVCIIFRTRTKIYFLYVYLFRIIARLTEFVCLPRILFYGIDVAAIFLE